MDWIDVNTRLPETGKESVYSSKWVIVSYLFDGKQYEGEGLFVNIPSDPYWFDVHRDKINVTHWMPMPDSPKM